MGGTSTDVSRFDGEYRHVYDVEIAGVTIQVHPLHLSIYLPIYIPSHLYLSIYLSIYIPLHLYLYIYIPLHLYLYLFIDT